MGRTMAGVAIPFDGRINACDEDANNFWGPPCAKEAKNARVVLRRVSQGKPAGIAIVTDCGVASWRVSDIFVR